MNVNLKKKKKSIIADDPKYTQFKIAEIILYSKDFSNEKI